VAPQGKGGKELDCGLSHKQGEQSGSGNTDKSQVTKQVTVMKQV